jgi:drug/metabolite transporter (DMT)-like permease
MPAGKIWLAVAIAAAGLYFMTGADAGVNIGDAMTLVCALFCAVQITLLAKYTRYCDPMHLVFVQIAVVAALSTLLVAPLGEVPASFPLQALAIIAYLALFGSILAQWGIAEAQRHMETSKAALILLSQLIFAALFSYLVWGETFTALKTAGALLILLALFIAEYDGIRI